MMNRRPRAFWITASATFVVLGSLAAAQTYDPVGDGHALVTMYCADCHATEAVGDSPLPAAPRFRELHLRYDVELLGEALVEGIVTHPQMPEFEFDPEQAEAIIAYLKSLESRAPANGDSK